MLPDIYLQIIVTDIFFYIIFYQMVRFKSWIAWGHVPFIVVSILTDMGALYYASGATEQNMQIVTAVEGVVSVSAVLLHLLVFEADLWKVGVTMMISDLLCAPPLMLSAVPAENSSENLQTLIGGLPYVPYGIIFSIIIFSVMFCLLRKGLRRFLTEPLEKRLVFRILAILLWANVLGGFIESFPIGVVQGNSQIAAYGIYCIMGILLVVIFYKEYERMKTERKLYLEKQNRMVKEHYKALEEQMELTEEYRKVLEEAERKKG